MLERLGVRTPFINMIHCVGRVGAVPGRRRRCRTPRYVGGMLYLDQPAWPSRGRLWSHLISDVSYAELHAFAEALGSPRRAFDRDHYDIPATRFAMAVWLGARVVPSRELARLLRAAGLRRPKHLVRAAQAGDLATSQER
ncbi:DUF4031 domain-containing protein [Micromonospora musae]|uniref:DUF4031 domain-containing protein n=2 Tax=Micromonospora TaxID=1873 RepID=UPI0034224619